MQTQVRIERIPVSRFIIPPHEGETKMVSLRVPEQLLERIQRIVDASGHDRSAVMLHLMRWAVQEWEDEQDKAKH